MHMHVKLLTSRISVDENGIILSLEDGAVVELEQAEAQRLIDSGQAQRVNVESEPQPEPKPKRGKVKAI